MSSTYNDVKIQLMATGENNTTWGDNTNANWDAMSELVTGSADVPFSGSNVAVTLTDTSASQTARNLRLNLTGTSGGARTLTVPSIEKLYLVNNGLADAVTVKTAAGTGIAVPAGKTMWVFADATNVVDVVTALTSLSLGTALTVASGGTGASTLTGIVKGNGTTAFTAASAGTDYVAPGTATTFTAKQTFAGGTGVFGVKLVSALEKITVSATAATGTVTYDTTTQNILYYTSNASANWTVNFRGDGSNSLDSLLATGESLTVAFRVTQGATAYYNNAVQVDGTTSGVTTKWLGGAPTAGVASGVDTYLYEIIKTGSATFTVFASKASFS